MNYQLIRTKRKTLALQINQNAQLLVRAPMRLSIKMIEEFIAQKQNWISKKQTERLQKVATKYDYQAGDIFLFLGEKYSLRLTNTGEPVQFKNEQLSLNQNYDGNSAFHWFYKKEFHKIAPSRIEYYAKKHHVNFNKVRFKAQKTRWGSCSNTNNINLNYLLMMAPMSVINAVIAHELAHTRHKNHNKDFYALLSVMIPEYKRADAWLKQNNQKLHAL